MAERRGTALAPAPAGGPVWAAVGADPASMTNVESMSEHMRAEKQEAEKATEAVDATESPDSRDAGATDDEGAARDADVAEEPSPAASGADDAAGDEDLEALQAELNALNERHLRLAAEFDNYRKRTGREREGLRSRAQADLAKSLLEVLDDLQRVAEYEVDAVSVESILEGVQLVEKKFRHALASAGLEPIQAEGEFFNPNTMEALMTVPAEHPEEDDVVADVFQKGYRFDDVLIRPARVRVKKYQQDG